LEPQDYSTKLYLAASLTNRNSDKTRKTWITKKFMKFIAYLAPSGRDNRKNYIR